MNEELEQNIYEAGLFVNRKRAGRNLMCKPARCSACNSPAKINYDQRYFHRTGCPNKDCIVSHDLPRELWRKEMGDESGVIPSGEFCFDASNIERPMCQHASIQSIQGCNAVYVCNKYCESKLEVVHLDDGRYKNLIDFKKCDQCLEENP